MFSYKSTKHSGKRFSEEESLRAKQMDQDHVTPQNVLQLLKHEELSFQTNQKR